MDLFYALARVINAEANLDVGHRPHLKENIVVNEIVFKLGPTHNSLQT